jgi:hypothetical protein
MLLGKQAMAQHQTNRHHLGDRLYVPEECAYIGLPDADYSTDYNRVAPAPADIPGSRNFELEALEGERINRTRRGIKRGSALLIKRPDAECYFPEK